MVRGRNKVIASKFNVRETEVVGRSTGEMLEPVCQIIAEIPDGAAVERRESRRTGHGHASEKVSKSLKRMTGADDRLAVSLDAFYTWTRAAKQEMRVGRDERVALPCR